CVRDPPWGSRRFDVW
nr:immunoglobulin heavy chain junction region [Macaca mulatta]